MIGLVVATVLAIAVLAAAVVSMERQMKAMAARLVSWRKGKGGGVTLDAPTPAARRLALEVNALIDDADATRIAAAEERRELQRNLASFSHDVRTPLAGAQGYLQLYALAETAKERDECVEEAAWRLGAMRVLVDQLFEYAKESDGQRERDVAEVDVAAVLEDCLAELYPSFVALGWEPEVVAATSVRVMADEGALRRIVENVLANCLHYGSAPPQIRLETENGAFRLTVSNAAEGLEDLDESRLCERFYRGDAARQRAGSGLGLAIASSLASSMGMCFGVAISDQRFVATLAGKEVR